MPSANEIYSGRFLSAVVVKNTGLEGKALMISGVGVEELGQGEKTKTKIILALNGIAKSLALNKINSSKLSKAYGDDYEKWIGKSLILRIREVDFSGETVEAIRVEIPPASDLWFCKHEFMKDEKGETRCIYCGLPA